MIEFKSYNLKMTFTAPVLGTQPGKDTTASDFLKKKNRDALLKKGVITKDEMKLMEAQEIESLPEELEKGTTGFARTDDDKPAVFNYHIKGMIKEAADVMNGWHNHKALKSKVDNVLVVAPRIIPFENASEITILERPLRAMTMQGPRVSLARSEQIEAGAILQCQIKTITTPKFEMTRDLLEHLLEYNSVKGFSQWRNSGAYGQFLFELKDLR